MLFSPKNPKEKANPIIIGYFASILAGLFFGVIPVLSAFLREAGASSFEQVILRLIFGGFFGIITIFKSFKQDYFRITLKMNLQLIYLLQGFIFSLAIMFYLTSISLRTPIGQASLLVQIHPFITLTIGGLFLKEKITQKHLIGVILAFLGLTLLTRPWDWSQFFDYILGNVLACFNGITYAIYLILGSQSAPHRQQIPSILSLSWVMFWGFLTILPLILLISLLPFPKEITAITPSIFIPEIILLGLLLTIFGSIIPYFTIMFTNTFNIESSKQSILLLGEPLSAIILSFLFLGEEITIWYVLGGIFLLGAIINVSLAKKASSKNMYSSDS